MSKVRYTLEGNIAVEKLIANIIEEVKVSLEPHLPKGHWTSLLLIGGYGRGEGGAETLTDGTQRPHNNLDLLLITRGLSNDERVELKAKLDSILGKLAYKHSVGMDLGMIDETKLRHSPAMVMWYDARFGHKTLLGNADLLLSLTRFTRELIPYWDIRNLMVNRGTLLVINEMIFAKGIKNEDEYRTVVKHIVKAIIGYGDALLFSNDQYHWSYAQKRKRMQQMPTVCGRFKALYDEAITFRFNPDYTRFVNRDLKQWQTDLYCQLQEIHLAVERQRLRKPGLTWDGYIESALATSLHPKEKGWLRQGYRLVRGTPVVTPRSLSLQASLGLRAGGPQEAIAATFPTALYTLPEVRERSLASELLGSVSLSQESLRLAYLRTWRTHGDINFATVVQKLGLNLEEAS
jgi:hypothetical protein